MKRRSGQRKGGLFKFLGGFIQGAFQLIWKTLPVTLTLFFFYLTFFGVHRFLYADPYFQIRTIKVFPKGILNTEEYGILEKKCSNANILEYDLSGLASFIQTNPRVKEAKIFRKLPNEIEVFITPRVPLIQVKLTPKGDYYTLDQEGIVMAKSKLPDPGLIILENFDNVKKTLTIFEQYQQEAFLKLPGILTAFRTNPVTADETISKISVDHLGNYSIFLLNGPELKICQNTEDNLVKLNAIGELIQTQKRSEIAYIDFCMDDLVIRPITKK